MFHNAIIMETVVGEGRSLHSADCSGACYGAQASLEVMALLPLHLQCCNHKRAPIGLADVLFGIRYKVAFVLGKHPTR